MKRFLLSALLAGCFPYRETWRPALDGVVLDRQAQPVAGARIESCSASRWNPSKCRARANTSSDGDGRFHLDKHTEWEWCCLGEAPMPFTVLAACTGDGRAGSARVQGAEPVRITLGVSDEWAARACGRR